MKDDGGSFVGCHGDDNESNESLHELSFKGSYSSRRTIDSSSQSCTFILRPGQYSLGDPAETRTCDLTRGSQAL